MVEPNPAEKQALRTLQLTPRNNEAIKPAELIQVTGHHELTLNARRAITILWHLSLIHICLVQLIGNGIRGRNALLHLSRLIEKLR